MEDSDLGTRGRINKCIQTIPVRIRPRSANEIITVQTMQRKNTVRFNNVT